MIYTVQPGDTLNGIAIRILGSASQASTLFGINRSRIKSGSPSLLAAGEQLVIPDQMIAAGKAARRTAAPSEEVVLVVNGLEYVGWESFQVSRSLETAAGAFAVDVTDRWQPGSEPWPIFDGDEVRVYVGADLLIVGNVDDVGLSLAADGHTMRVSGRDRTADLVDCSAMARPGTFKGKKLEEIASILAKPFGIEVRADVDTGAPIQSFALQPGERVHEAIVRAAIAKNLIVTSGASGGLLITRSGDQRTVDAIVEGANLLAGDSRASSAERFSEYVVEGQASGQGQAKNAMRATYRDAAVRRYRPLMIHAEQKATAEYVRARAEWEARVRAARARGATVTVAGWRQSDGSLWQTNRIVGVESPSLGLSEDMLIGAVTFSLDSGGRTTALSLVRPDAYTSEDHLDAEKDAFRRGKKGGKGKKAGVSKADIDAALRDAGL